MLQTELENSKAWKDGYKKGFRAGKDTTKKRPQGSVSGSCLQSTEVDNNPIIAQTELRKKIVNSLSKAQMNAIDIIGEKCIEEEADKLLDLFTAHSISELDEHIADILEIKVIQEVIEL